jgi:hypothetical protein
VGIYELADMVSIAFERKLFRDSLLNLAKVYLFSSNRLECLYVYARISSRRDASSGSFSQIAVQLPYLFSRRFLG